MKILIGSAWPYANGSLHIGHLAALLPADVLARYYRAKGDSVYYVSGSDCYGTPVSIRAKQENKTPGEISNDYHREFCDCFEKLGFSYDRYGKTSSTEHRDFVSDFHRKMYDGGYIYEKEAPQAYCESCGKSLTDRFVVGNCPICGKNARGDQCDDCGAVLEPESLLSPRCAVCGEAVVFRQTRHLFIAISKLEDELTAYLKTHPDWRKNAVAFTKRYIDEGLRDRAITRDLDWGIDVPKAGYEDKKIYIWAENVLGYLSMSKVVAENRGENYADLWGDDSRHYYVHGKDNIPFHTLILPSLMLANGGAWKLPDEIISSEYLTLEGRKISTSQNWAIWSKDIVDRYNPDSIRYFMIANGPERRDSDFSWREFVGSHNGELLGAYGNFVNRTLAFLYKYGGGIVPKGELDTAIGTKIAALYPQVGTLIENGNLKDALDTVFAFVRFGNKYFDAEKPWETRQTNAAACDHTLFNCVQIIANLAILLEPFLPFSSKKVKTWLQMDGGWSIKEIPADFIVPQPDILFERLDKSVIDEEMSKLKSSPSPETA
jgi:methionyl-tRNA synthetase